MTAETRIARHTKVDRWTLFDGNFEWADFYVDHSLRVTEKRASTSVQVVVDSSFGTWAHWWMDCGPSDWRLFLLECEMDYVMGKLMGRAWSMEDPEQTIKSARADVLEQRRSGSCDAAMARAAWNALRDLEANRADCRAIVECLSEERFWRDSYCEVVRTKPNPAGVQFWTKFWTPWVQHLVSGPAPSS